MSIQTQCRNKYVLELQNKSDSYTTEIMKNSTIELFKATLIEHPK